MILPQHLASSFQITPNPRTTPNTFQIIKSSKQIQSNSSVAIPQKASKRPGSGWKKTWWLLGNLLLRRSLHRETERRISKRKNQSKITKNQSFTGISWNFFGTPLTFVLTGEATKKSQESGRSTKYPKESRRLTTCGIMTACESFFASYENYNLKQWEIFKNVRSMCRVSFLSLSSLHPSVDAKQPQSFLVASQFGGSTEPAQGQDPLIPWATLNQIGTSTKTGLGENARVTHGITWWHQVSIKLHQISKLQNPKSKLQNQNSKIQNQNSKIQNLKQWKSKSNIYRGSNFQVYKTIKNKRMLASGAKNGIARRAGLRIN